TPTIAALELLFFLTNFAIAQLEATLSRLTEAAFEMPGKANFYLFTYIGLALTIVQGGIVRRIDARDGGATLVLSGLAMLGVGLWLVNHAAAQQSMYALIAFLPLVVTGFAFVTPAVQALISRRSDPARQGEILVLSQSASAMARILGPLAG